MERRRRKSIAIIPFQHLIYQPAALVPSSSPFDVQMSDNLQMCAVSKNLSLLKRCLTLFCKRIVLVRRTTTTHPYWVHSRTLPFSYTYHSKKHPVRNHYFRRVRHVFIIHGVKCSCVPTWDRIKVALVSTAVCCARASTSLSTRHCSRHPAV